MKKVVFSILSVSLLTTSFYIKDQPAEQAAESKTKIKQVRFTSKAANSVDIYHSIDFGNCDTLSQDVFDKALHGFNKLKIVRSLPESAHILTVCDFSLSSNRKRMWVFDLESKKVLFNSLVAHGKNTGEEFARHFSNMEGSLASSIGFYITESAYNGENGYSLKLLGMDKGYNDAALQRAVVMHGADYVSEEFAREHQRIGRSWGCPAIPRDLAEPVINTIKDRNCLFIYYPDTQYLQSSEWLRDT